MGQLKNRHAPKLHSLEVIASTVAAVWFVDLDELTGPSKFGPPAQAKGAFAVLADESGWTSAQSGEFLGRDHSTVVHNRRRMLRTCEANAEAGANLELARRILLRQADAPVRPPPPPEVRPVVVATARTPAPIDEVYHAARRRARWMRECGFLSAQGSGSGCG